MTELTQDEFTCLMIMAEGASLAAIGRWEKPLDCLVERGLASRHDKFNNAITPAGRMALDERETGDAKAVLANAAQVTAAHEVALANVEQAAKNLAAAARATAPVTGDDPNTALISWNIQCLKRARELLRG
jgi:hypothetical protein